MEKPLLRRLGTRLRRTCGASDPGDRGADRRGPRRRADGRQRRRRRRLLRAGRPRGDRGRALGGDDRPAPAGAAPAVRRAAEALPFEDDSFDAAMAVLTVHHWRRPRGRPGGDATGRQRRVVIVTFDPGPLRDFWIVRDYFPAIAGMHSSASRARLGSPRAARGERQPIPVPRECTDLFFAALWARPGDGPRPRRGAADVGLAEPVGGATEGGPRATRRRPGLRRLGGAQRAPARRRRSTSATIGRLMQPLTAQLEGSIVVLEPLTEEHAEELWEAAQAPEIWAWLANLNERERFDRWLELTFEAARAGTRGAVPTRELAAGTAIGSSRYLNVRPADRVVEIGWTWLQPARLADRRQRRGEAADARSTPSRRSTACGSSSRPTPATSARGRRWPRSRRSSRASCAST